VSVGQDPRYGRLADRVLSTWSIPASGRVDVKRAILAQWQCEQPSNAWPPVLNNPGFVTLGALHSWGLDLGAVCGKQYPSFCLARFPSPEAGADAYAGGVLRGSRYAGALAAARAGNGLRFLNLITSAGWGTRYSCARVAFAGLGGKVPAVTPGGTDATNASAEANGCTLAARLNVPCSTIIDEALVQRIADLYMATFNTPGHQVPGGRDTVVNAYWTKIGQPLSAIGSAGLSGDPFGDITTGISGAVNDAIGAATDAIGQVFRNVAVLVFILVLLLVGLFVLATANDGPGPRLPIPVPV
jgi:hypothetical protein